MLSDERIEQLELEVKVLRANNKGLKDKIDEQSKEIEELKNADLTTVYLNGFYDGEKKVKDKIKAKIEEVQDIRKHHLDEIKNIEVYNHTKQLWLKELDTKYIVLQSLLEKE